jgi:nitroimidazol reductase NimA-like FMN-containing flavoprotein (pyridoxamine 5'-phosphate oxidase superfamily)
MEYRLADPELKEMDRNEVSDLLNQPIYLRLAMINAKDGSPLVHPIWYYYDEEKFYAVSNTMGVKVRSLKKNPDVYFLVDVTDRGVRGRAKAKVIDDPSYAKEITARNLTRYLGSLDSPEAKERLEISRNYSAIEITPDYMASWKA